MSGFRVRPPPAPGPRRPARARRTGPSRWRRRRTAGDRNGRPRERRSAVHPPAWQGAALSLWQIEPATALDAVQRLPAVARSRFQALLPGTSAVESVLLARLPGDLYLGAALCRLVYYLKPFTVPASAAVEDLARIWKQHYNTPQGAGTAEQFLANWRRHGMDELYP